MSQYKVNQITPFKNFEDASQAVLQHLQTQFGFGLWMMTRTIDNDWIVLQAATKSYKVSKGDVFQWSDSFCSRMVSGEGPNIAPKSVEIPAYINAPINQQVEINAYIGLPIHLEDGSLFGTLCAIDPQPQKEELHAALPCLKLMTKLLSSLISCELKNQEPSKTIKIDELLAKRGSKKRIENLIHWESANVNAERRNALLGSPVHILIIDIEELVQQDEKNPKLEAVKNGISTILNHLSHYDAITRFENNSLAVLMSETPQKELDHTIDNLYETFALQETNVTIGFAKHKNGSLITQTFENAKQSLYTIKNSKQYA